MKSLVTIFTVLLIASAPVVAADAGKDLVKRHNTFFDKIHKANSRAQKCNIMGEFYHSSVIQLAVVNQYAQQINNDISNLGSEYYQKNKTMPGAQTLIPILYNNAYATKSTGEKFAAFCRNPDLKGFADLDFKSIVRANKTVSVGNMEAVLAGTMDESSKRSLYYVWKKDGDGTWRFYKASAIPNIYLDLTPKAKKALKTLIVDMQTIDFTFKECLNEENNIFNSADFTLMMTLLYGEDFKSFNSEKNQSLQTATEQRIAQTRSTLRKPNACDSDQARGQILMFLLKSIYHNKEQAATIAAKQVNDEL